MSEKRRNCNIPSKEQETSENMKLENCKLQTDRSQAKLKNKKVNSKMRQLLANLRASSIGFYEIKNILSSVPKNRRKLRSELRGSL